MSDIRAEMEAAYDADSDASAPSTADISTDSASSVAPSDSPSEPASELPAPQASDTAAATPETTAPGPIPFTRHQEILTNARKEYEWVKEHGDTQTVQQKLAILRRAEQDPAGFLRDFAHAAGLNPQQLFTPPPQPAPAPELPQPDVLFENGQTAYSAERLAELLKFEREQVLQRVNQEYRPLKERAIAADMQQRSHSTAQQLLAQARAEYPEFSEHEKEMGQVFYEAMRSGKPITLEQAYIRVVAPKLRERVEVERTQAYQKALADLQTKAGAASIPAPRTAAAVGPDTSRMSFRELLEAAYEG